MKVKNSLRKRLENFLGSYPRWLEYGGFLLKSNRTKTISEFLPIPNVSDNPKTRFGTPKNSLDLAKKLADSRRMTVEAFFHSHPDPCIMSVADRSYAETYNSLIFVTISPIEQYGRRYIWYACKGIKPIPIKFVGK